MKNEPLSTRQRGQNAETLAARYLSKKGLQILQQNFTCRLGEIDLIMQDGETLVFIEVRMRKQASHGSGAETVNIFKQRKIIRAAKLYLQINQLTEQVPCRFDVLSLLQNGTELHIEWFKDAFRVG